MIKHIIYISIIVIGLFVGMIKLKTLTKSNKAFLLLLVFTLFAEITGYIITLYKSSNFIVYHIFAPIQCSLILVGYFYEISIKYIRIIVFFMIALSVIMSLWVQPLPEANSYYMSIELFLFVLLPVLYFWRLLNIETSITLSNYPIFWISSGLIIFSISNFFVLATYNYFVKLDTTPNEILNIILLHIRYFSNYIFYSSFIVAFLVKQNTISNQNDK